MSTGSGRCSNIWESRLVYESITNHPNKTSPKGDSLCLAPSNGKGKPITREAKVVQYWAHAPERLVHWSAGNAIDVHVPVPLPAAAAHHTRVSAIYPVWQLPVVHPVIDEACTLVFHFYQLPLCMVTSVIWWLSHLHPYIYKEFQKGHFWRCV